MAAVSWAAIGGIIDHVEEGLTRATKPQATQAEIGARQIFSGWSPSRSLRGRKRRTSALDRGARSRPKLTRPLSCRELRGKRSRCTNILEFESICISQPVRSPHTFRRSCEVPRKTRRIGAFSPLTFDPETVSRDAYGPFLADRLFSQFRGQRSPSSRATTIALYSRVRIHQHQSNSRVSTRILAILRVPR